MTTVWTKRFVNALLVLVMIAALAAIVRAGGLIADGELHMVSYPASTSETVVHPLDREGEGKAFWLLRQGSIRVHDLTWLSMARLIGRFAGLALLAGIFWQLRALLIRIGEGDVFSDANIVALRMIGKLLVVASLLSISITFMTQYAILEALPDVLDGNRAVHPSISWDVKGVENIWMEYEPPIISVLLALTAFVTAGAFKSGKSYREDSESVV